MKIATILGAIFVFATANPIAALASRISTCTWEALDHNLRDNIVSGYGSSMGTGAAILTAHDPEIMAALAECAGRNDIPSLWAQGAIGSFAIQAGMAQALAQHPGIDRATLDRQWAQAPDAARNCFLANSAKIFGANGPSCPDTKAILWFVENLNIPITLNVNSSAGKIPIFYNAKAQNDWAEAIIDHFISNE